MEQIDAANSTHPVNLHAIVYPLARPPTTGAWHATATVPATVATAAAADVSSPTTTTTTAPVAPALYAAPVAAVLRAGGVAGR